MGLRYDDRWTESRAGERALRCGTRCREYSVAFWRRGEVEGVEDEVVDWIDSRFWQGAVHGREWVPVVITLLLHWYVVPASTLPCSMLPACRCLCLLVRYVVVDYYYIMPYMSLLPPFTPRATVRTFCIFVHSFSLSFISFISFVVVIFYGQSWCQLNAWTNNDSMDDRQENGGHGWCQRRTWPPACLPVPVASRCVGLSFVGAWVHGGRWCERCWNGTFEHGHTGLHAPLPVFLFCCYWKMNIFFY